MARLCLIGDSNINLSVDPLKLTSSVGHNVTYYRATNKMSLENYLEAAQRKNYEVLVLSVLPNLISDLSVGSLPASLSGLYEWFISKLVSLGISRILLVPPILRYQPTWYPENHGVMLKLLQDSLVKESGICLLPNFPIQISDLSSDGVHFTSATSTRFYEYLLSSIKDVIDTDVVPVPQPMTTIDELAQLIRSSVPEVAKKVEKLEARIDTRQDGDNEMFARLREENDFKLNLSRDHRVLFINVIGQKNTDKVSEYKQYLAQLLEPLLKSVFGDGEGFSYNLFPRRGNPRNNILPPFELQLGSSGLALKLRREGSRHLVNFPAFKDSTICPCITLGTRVRYEVLRAIARKLTSDDKSGYVPLHGLRPLLHVGPRVQGKVSIRETYTYVDAVLKYQKLISRDDLAYAYTRSGEQFKGTMRQNFIVLDDGPKPSSKRPMESEASESGSSKRKK